MNNKPIPQLGAAMALVELVKEAHAAGLPSVPWHITRHGVLDANLHLISEPLATLASYASLVGGEMTARHRYEVGGRTMQSYYVVAQWRDVTVELSTGVEVTTVAQVAA